MSEKFQSNKEAKDFIEKSIRKEMFLPPYSGIPTFLRTAFCKEYDDLDIALIGVPFDQGITMRPGARFGPREIRNQSGFMGFQNHQSKIIPYANLKIADIGDVSISDRYTLDKGILEIENFYKNINKAGVVPFSAGGDHSITYPILKVLGAKKPLGLIHIDAHCDTMPEAYGSKFHHGGPFRNAVKDGVLDPKRTVQIGIRGPHEHCWDFSYEKGMRVIHIEEFYEMGINSVIKEVRSMVGNLPTYISFDIDALDPAYAPGTGTPEIGGITSFEAQQLIRGFQGLNLIGGDIVEVSPPFDKNNSTALVGATLMFEMLCIISDSELKKKYIKKI